MQVVSFTEARSSFKSVIDRVVDDNDATLIYRRDGENAVLLSEASFNSMMETMHLLASPANARSLLKAIAQDKKGQAKRKTLIAL